MIGAASTTARRLLLLRRSPLGAARLGRQQGVMAPRASPAAAPARYESSLKDQAQGKAQELKDQAQGKAQDLKREVKYQTSTQPPRGSNQEIKFWPFALIIVIATGAFVAITKTRAERKTAPVRRPGEIHVRG
ncbi:hypothetical protein GGR56DRAFT_622945 [Xylariaceae sp. FL0804]|nr:hypothetical protein GGR56DRAFT_622945 [Xylariaceae sp. FL0804]